MSRLNRASKPARTHEGGRAKRISPLQELRRTVCASFLWEDSFYEKGESIAKRAARLAGTVDLDGMIKRSRSIPLREIGDLAVEVRHEHNLRHMPLLLVAAMLKRPDGGSVTQHTIAKVVDRVDEMTELVAIYGHLNGVSMIGPDHVPLPAQMKKGLARAVKKFDAYQLAKYNRRDGIRLKTIFELVRPRPETDEQSRTWKQLLNGTLPAPDTWEVALSAGADKRETFTRLLQEGKLGYLALLRNLRGMVDAGVDAELIKDAIILRKGARRVLPFRYTAAARACPQMEPTLDQALSEHVLSGPPLPGKTIILVDVSGSMTDPLSRKSDLTRVDAAATLGSIVHGDTRVFTFSNDLVEVPPRIGMAGVDAIRNSQRWGGTYLGAAVSKINTFEHDRLIVITDEQSHDSVLDPVARHAYMINVAGYQNGVGYGRWTHIDGFSEAVLKFIWMHEQIEQDIAQDRDEQESAQDARMPTLSEAKATVDAQEADRQKALMGGSPLGIACDKCGSELRDASPGEILTMDPPQIRVNCPNCKYRGMAPATIRGINKKTGTVPA